MISAPPTVLIVRRVWIVASIHCRLRVGGRERVLPFGGREVICGGSYCPLCRDRNERGLRSRGIEFSGSGAFRAAQFGFSALDGVGCSEAGDELREIVSEGAFEQVLCSCEGVKLGLGSVIRWFNRRSRGLARAGRAGQRVCFPCGRASANQVWAGQGSRQAA